MYTIKKLSRNDVDFNESDIEKYNIVFQFEKSRAEVEITLKAPSQKIFPRSNNGIMFYVLSQTDGYHWLNFWLAQEPNAVKLICQERDEMKVIRVRYNGIRFPWEFQGNDERAYKLRDLDLNGVIAYDSERISTYKVAMLFEAFGLQYVREDKEACFLYHNGMEGTAIILERICSIIEPRFALSDKLFVD
jgi:hypothetical protein